MIYDGRVAETSVIKASLFIITGTFSMELKTCPHDEGYHVPEYKENEN